MDTSFSDTRYDRFIHTYQTLGPGVDPAPLLADLYHDDVVFKDPFHQISGLEHMVKYFDGLYANLSDCRFEFHEILSQHQLGTVFWTLTFRHPKLHGGNKDIQVEGMSMLHWRDDKIMVHQDFFDGGAMIYEHLPVMGWAIRKLKERMV